MPIGNLKVTTDKSVVRAGVDKVRFFFSWTGNSSYKGQYADSLKIRGLGGFEGIEATNLIGSGSGENFYADVPAKWVGDVKGSFALTFYVRSSGMTTSAETTPEITLTVEPKDLNFGVSLTPANPTIKPGETAVFQPIISGVSMPYVVEYKWSYKTSPIGGNTNTLSIPYSTPGYEFVLCDVTITKDGYRPKTVRGETRLTMAKGTLDGLSLMLNKIQPNLPVFSSGPFEAVVQGVPASATVYYEWIADGVRFGNTAESTFRPLKPGTANVQCIVSVSSPDFDAKTIESPIIPVTVNKLTPDDLNIFMAESDFRIGPEAPLSWNTNILRPTELSETTVKAKSVAIQVDGAAKPSVLETYTDYSVVRMNDRMNLLKDIGDHELNFTLDFDESEFVSAGSTTRRHPFTIKKCDKFFDTGAFFVDGKPLTSVGAVMIKAQPSETIHIAVENMIDPQWEQGTPEYITELKALAKSGEYQLINKDGVVEVVAVDGVFTYTVPAEIKTLNGRLHHVIDRPDYYDTPGPLVAGRDIKIDIVSNPMIPTPTMTIVQEPFPAYIGKPIKLTRTFTNLPVDVDTTNTQWYFNDATTVTTEEYNIDAIPGDMVANVTNIMPAEFDPMVITAEHQLNVVAKPWPTITLDLMPARTTVPWGEFLVSGYDIVGEEAVEDPTKMSFGLVHWFVDNVLVDSLSSDGSLSIRATKPGLHTIKCETDLYHPDYVDGRLTISKTFNMTTEPRDMATVLSLLPTNPSVEKGKTQKFTATVTGAPADSTTVYKWEVDGVVQSSVVNNMDFVTTKVGKNVIKVTSTTSAQDAADDVQTATTELTVTKITQTTTGSITPATQTINQDTNYSATANVTDAPAGATITYLWSDGSTTATTSKKATKAETINLTCKITVKATDYTDKVIDATATVNVTQIKVPGFVASISSDKQKVEIGEAYKVSISTNASPISGNRFTYLWNTGETTMTIDKVGTSVGVVTHTCEVKVENPDYLTDTKTVSTNVEVEDNTPVIPDECEIQYVHPLPHRNSAFIWAGWWVMDEIEAITKAGGDWKQPQPNSKYKCHLATLAKMISDFPEVDVQESRHGRIVHRSALDLGIIYG